MPKEVSILVVEDDEIDMTAIERAFNKLKITNPIHKARDGIEALEVLRGNESNPPLKRPYLILLDLNMPRMGGLEFLKVIRNDATLKDSIVFVLTTSDADEDKVEAYNYNVAGYIVKFEFGDVFFKAASMLDNYWQLIELP